MTEIDYVTEAARARAMRLQAGLDRLDYLREIARLATLGGDINHWAATLKTNPHDLAADFHEAQNTPPCRPGFPAASPYELCQRYAAQQLTRDQLINHLTHWEYTIPEPQEHDYYDDLRFTKPGSFDDVGIAFDQGLIDDEIYDSILDSLP
jgi:hypothetical protein